MILIFIAVGYGAYYFVSKYNVVDTVEAEMKKKTI
jgi:hypothetical protein